MSFQLNFFREGGFTTAQKYEIEEAKRKKRIEELGIEIVEKNFLSEKTKLEKGVFIRTDKGRILEVLEKKEKGVIVCLKDKKTNREKMVLIKEESILKIGKNISDLFNHGDIIFVHTNSFMGQLFFKEVGKIKKKKIILGKSKTNNIYFFEEKDIKGFLTLKSKSLKIANDYLEGSKIIE